jgi:16S rRNA (adenine1518-N6/adenine1519-N6)-dimethyltransferase
VDEEPDYGGVTSKQFDSTVRAAFAHRRKVATNSLAATFGKEASREAVEAAGIDPGLRAEALSVDDYRRLAKALHSNV